MSAITLVVLQILVFRNGRRVLTDLASIEQVEAFEHDRDFPDWGYYNWCERNDKPLPMGAYYGATVVDLDPVPGSPYAMWLEHGDVDFEEELYRQECEARRAMEDVDIHDLLEQPRPKARRRKVLPECHPKRWGHGRQRDLAIQVA